MNEEVEPERKSRWWRRCILPIVVLVGAVAAARVLIHTRPHVARQEIAIPTPLVHVIDVEPTTHRVTVAVFGTVEADRHLTVRPQLSGIVVEQHPTLLDGGRLRKGDTLIKIDPRDFETRRMNAQADLARAEFELKLEEGQQVVARREWSLLNKRSKIGGANRDLTLRVPHLAEKKAALAAAESRLRQAEVDLERTTLLAPFDAWVLMEDVEPGQLVNPQTRVAEVVATDQFRVQITVPIEKLAGIKLPNARGEGGASARVILDTGKGPRVERTAHVSRLLGSLDERGRLARLHVTVPDPLGLGAEEAGLPLLIGSYVRVEIAGEELQDVHVIPRSALRNGNRVWTVDRDDVLVWQDVTVVDRTKTHVVVRIGGEDLSRLITSSLPAAIPGMAVQIAEDHSAAQADGGTSARSLVGR